MTEPVRYLPPQPLPMTRERLKDHLESLGLTPWQVERALMGADGYAAQMIEECARPDDRWGPR